MIEEKKEKCECDSPHRDYGTTVCLNCGGVLDFESDRIFKINEDGSVTEF